MWRRLNREDLFERNQLLTQRPHRSFVWRVYEDYELIEKDGENAYFRAKDAAKVSKRYAPQVDPVHLFLEFARLYERKDTDQAVREWISKYGLLGLHQDTSSGFHSFPPRGISTPREYSDKGGPGETLRRIEEEVRRSNQALVMYEAALSEDVEKLEQVWGIRGSSPAARSGQRFFQNRSAESVGGTYVDALVDGCTVTAVNLVQDAIQAFAYPCVFSPAPDIDQLRQRKRLLLKPRLLSSSLWPRNLLGAMYIQFYWLITSAGELSHCKYCGRIISYAPLLLVGDEGRKARKPRRDKEFCDSRCRQNYHYNNRIKPRRQSERR